MSGINGKNVLFTESAQKKSQVDKSTLQGECVKRVRKEPRRGLQAPPEKTESFQTATLDQRDVFGMPASKRVKWLAKVLVLAGRGAIKGSAVYDLLAHPKFVAGFSGGNGRKARALSMANLHMFSAKQQKFLQSDACKLSEYELTAEEKDEENPSGKRGRSRSSESGGGDGPPAGGGKRPAARSRSGSAPVTEPEKPPSSIGITMKLAVSGPAGKASGPVMFSGKAIFGDTQETAEAHGTDRHQKNRRGDRQRVTHREQPTTHDRGRRDAPAPRRNRSPSYSSYSSYSRSRSRSRKGRRR